MFNKRTIFGLACIAVALLILGNQALMKLMEKKTQTLFLPDIINTDLIQDISFLEFLVTTPLHLLVGGLGIFFVIFGVFRQK
jgi:hypothetical protein